MGLGDFVIHKTHSDLLVALTPVNPIHGVSSLAMRRNGVTGDGTYQAMQIRPGETRAHGKTRGALRCLLRNDTDSTGSGTNFYGLCCMQSQEDLTSTSGAAYGLFLGGNQAPVGHDPGVTLFLRLVRITEGLNGPFGGNPYTAVIAQETDLELERGTVMALELAWDLNLAELSGIHLVAKRGTSYSDLETVFDVIETANVLATTVNESLVAMAASNGDLQVLFDTTRAQFPPA